MRGRVSLVFKMERGLVVRERRELVSDDVGCGHHRVYDRQNWVSSYALLVEFGKMRCSYMSSESFFGVWKELGV